MTGSGDPVRSPKAGPRSLPRALLLRALLWSLAFGLAHLLGFRYHTSIFSGTTSSGPLATLSTIRSHPLWAGP